MDCNCTLVLNYFLIVSKFSYSLFIPFQNFPSPTNPSFRRALSICTTDHQPVQMKAALTLLGEKFEVSHIWCSVLQCSDVTQPQKHFYWAGLLLLGTHSVCFSHDTILISPLLNKRNLKWNLYQQRFVGGDKGSSLGLSYEKMTTGTETH